MTLLVADTSGLVSLGSVAGQEPDPLGITLTTYHVAVPEAVLDELRELASYDDIHGRGADAVLDRQGALSLHSVALDEGFPLDDGENAAVTLANDVGADLFLCDEFNRLGLIHASLADTRLVTSPTLLSVFVRTGRLSTEAAIGLLDAMSEARSWGANSYVERARSLLESK